MCRAPGQDHIRVGCWARPGAVPGGRWAQLRAIWLMPVLEPTCLPCVPVLVSSRVSVRTPAHRPSSLRSHHSPSFRAWVGVSPRDRPGGVCFLSGPELRSEGDKGGHQGRPRGPAPSPEGQSAKQAPRESFLGTWNSGMVLVSPPHPTHGETGPEWGEDAPETLSMRGAGPGLRSPLTLCIFSTCFWGSAKVNGRRKEVFQTNSQKSSRVLSTVLIGNGARL